MQIGKVAQPEQVGPYIYKGQIYPVDGCIASNQLREKVTRNEKSRHPDYGNFGKQPARLLSLPRVQKHEPF